MRSLGTGAHMHAARHATMLRGARSGSECGVAASPRSVLVAAVEAGEEAGRGGG